MVADRIGRSLNLRVDRQGRFLEIEIVPEELEV
jgi:hypothetical protein